MSRIKTAVLAFVWGNAVFFFVFWLTFPATEVGDFATSHVSALTEGDWAISTEGVSPTVVGLTATGVLVQKASHGDMVPFMSVDDISVYTGPLDAIRLMSGDGGSVTVAVDAGGETLNATVNVVEDDGVLSANGVLVDGALALANIPAIGGVHLQGEGRVLIDSDVTWSDGFSSAMGEFTVTGDGLSITGLAFDDSSKGDLLGDVDPWPLGINKLHIKMRFDDGKATVRRGKLKSDWLDVSLSGTITLADDVVKSRANLKLVVHFSDVFEDLPFAVLVTATQKSALHKDGDYHYVWNTGFKRMSVPRPDRERVPSRSQRSSPTPRSTNTVERERKERPTATRKSREERRKGSERGPTRVIEPDDYEEFEEELDEDLDPEDDDEEDDEELEE